MRIYLEDEATQRDLVPFGPKLRSEWDEKGRPRRCGAKKVLQAEMCVKAGALPLASPPGVSASPPLEGNRGVSVACRSPFS